MAPPRVAERWGQRENQKGRAVDNMASRGASGAQAEAFHSTASRTRPFVRISEQLFILLQLVLCRLA
eukprot:1404601-Pyramimonas_sp.AAC.1